MQTKAFLVFLYQTLNLFFVYQNFEANSQIIAINHLQDTQTPTPGNKSSKTFSILPITNAKVLVQTINSLHIILC